MLPASLALASFLVFVPQDDAAGPLVTRFAADVVAGRGVSAYPRPLRVRERWLALDGLWEFEPESAASPFGRTLDGSIRVPFPMESVLSGVGAHHPRAYYRLVFTLPDAWGAFDDGQRLLLHFGAVDWECEPFLNGRSLGVHRGGYDPFTVDVTDALADRETQELVVRVFDSTDAAWQPRGKQVLAPGGIFYTPSSGIWQTVWLEPVPATSCADLLVTPDLARGVLHVDALLRGPEAADAAIECIARADGAEAGRYASPRDESGGRSGRAGSGRDRPAVVARSFDLPLGGASPPHAWTPEDPFLYDLEFRVLAPDGALLDTVTSYAGLRSIALGADPQGRARILLNGAPRLLVGVLDQGFWPDGLYTAPSDDALRADVQAMKDLGFNMVRKHVKVEPARWYQWCDRLGLLVMQDMPSGGPAIGGSDPDLDVSAPDDAQFEAELRAMIAALRGHPSLVHWVVFNEGWGQHRTAELTELVRQLDPSRLVTCASGWTDRGVGDTLDLHIYPGPGPVPTPADRAAVLGEFGGFGLAVEGHRWTQDNWGYRGTKDGAELTERYCDAMRRVWEMHASDALSASVYTQLTDVETECNGLLTYDREVVKVDAARVRAANEGRVPRLEPLLPIAPDPASGTIGDARPGVRPWRYTFSDPGPDFAAADFDASAWSEGAAGFGTPITPGARVGTPWDGPAIWLRRAFELDAVPDGDLRFVLHHDEDVEVYVNGVRAYARDGYTTDYETAPLPTEARAALHAGRNVLAVHCRQTTGGQYVDVGLARVKDP